MTTPALDGLVQAALVNNTDLQVAAANLRRGARRCCAATAAALPPTAGVSGRRRPRPLRRHATNPSPQADWTYTAGLDVSYEVDLFGRVRRGIEAAARRRRHRAPRPQDAVRVTVAAETARAYARGLRACRASRGGRPPLARPARSRAYDITASARRSGRRLRLRGRHAPSAAARAGPAPPVPTFEAQRKSALYQLAVLTGRPPAEISPAAAACASLPRTQARRSPIGDGAALLSRRPDVREARAQPGRGHRPHRAWPPPTSIRRVSLGGDLTSTYGRRHARRCSSVGNVTFGLGPLISLDLPQHDRGPRPYRRAEARSQAALARLRRRGAARRCRRPSRRWTYYAGELDRNAALTAARDQSAEAAAAGQHPLRRGLDQLPRTCSTPSAPWSRPTATWPPRASTWPKTRSTCSRRWAAAGNRPGGRDGGGE